MGRAGMIIDDRKRLLLVAALHSHAQALGKRILREDKAGGHTVMLIREQAEAEDLARDIECSR